MPKCPLNPKELFRVLCRQGVILFRAKPSCRNSIILDGKGKTQRAHSCVDFALQAAALVEKHLLGAAGLLKIMATYDGACFDFGLKAHGAPVSLLRSPSGVSLSRDHALLGCLLR